MQKQKRLIGISGKKGSGKSTFGNYLINQYGYTEYAFADPLKNICRELFSFTDAQLYGDRKEELDEYWNITPRHSFQKVGDILRDHSDTIIPGIGNKIFVEVLKRKVILDWEKNPNKLIVVTDVRFENEMKLIKELGGTIIKINRSTNNNDTHQSETNVDNLISDCTVNNDGTIEELFLNGTNAINKNYF